MEAAIASLSTLLKRNIETSKKSAFKSGGLLSFQDALSWLEKENTAIHKNTVATIAKVLEDDVPLDLPAIYPEWAFAVWTLFVHVLLSLLPAQPVEGEDDVYAWAREMRKLYGTPGSDSYDSFSGEDYEEEEIRALVTGVGGTENDMNLASRIVAEETLEVETWVWGDWEDAVEEDGKKGVEMLQLVLCLGMLK